MSHSPRGDMHTDLCAAPGLTGGGALFQGVSPVGTDLT
jgi:hypothetical protein